MSDTTRSDLMRLGVDPARISVVRNGHDAAAVPDAAERPVGHDRADEPRVVVVARLVPHKQIEHLLVLADRLRPTYPRLRVDVVGEGWWRGELVALAERLEVTDLVTFHGHVEVAERDRLLGRAWLQVLPSVKEGWGLAVTEAAAQGTATIGYRTSGGLTESIRDGVTGCLVDDLDELCRRVGELLGRPNVLTTMGRAAQGEADLLSWDRSARELGAVLAGADQRLP